MVVQRGSLEGEFGAMGGWQVIGGDGEEGDSGRCVAEMSRSRWEVGVRRQGESTRSPGNVR